MQNRNTNDIYPDNPTTTIPHPEQEATHFIDVHIYPLSPDQDDETRSIEATLDEISKANQPPDDSEQTGPITLIKPQPGRNVSPLLWVCVGIVLLALLGKGSLYLLPYLIPTTTITIIPVSTRVHVTSHITVVTGQADTTKDEIPGRQLSSLPITQTQTIPTTGKAHQDATSAAGTITFYNAALISQRIPAGTLLTGSNGIQVVTNHDAVIPPGSLSVNGSVLVTAHTLLTGKVSNMQARSIYGPCCRENVFASSSAFTGGQDAYEYQAVSDQDISTTATSLQKSLEQSARSALQSQVRAGETMLVPVCTPQVMSDHKAGDEATQVSITVNLTCTDVTYTTQALHDIVEQRVTRQAAQRPGTGSTRIGAIALTITGQQSTPRGDVLTVQGRGTWYAQLTPARLTALTQQIAGKSRTTATATLLHTTGIAQVEGLPDTLPTDPAHIQVLILYPQGAA